MTYRYSKTSIERLKTCHPDLQKVFYEVLNGFDHTILCGHRGREAQNKAFNEGKSKLRFPQSKHNSTPSMAVDVAPWYPDKPHIHWQEDENFTMFGGYVLGVAASMGVGLRWGGDWKQCNDRRKNDFEDLVHFELKE